MSKVGLSSPESEHTYCLHRSNLSYRYYRNHTLLSFPCHASVLVLRGRKRFMLSDHYFQHQKMCVVHCK